MSHPLSARLVAVFGPCRILLAGSPEAVILTDLLLAGCDAWALGLGEEHPRALGENSQIPAEPFDVIVVQADATQPVAAMVAPLVAAFGQPRAVALSAPGADRAGQERVLLDGGWRRHPADMNPTRFSSLADPGMDLVSLFEPVPAAVLQGWSVAAMLLHRLRRSDCLREISGVADAAFTRYALAAEFIRPGDQVLDCGCGLGYGAAVLACQSRAGRIIGIDKDESALAYATAAYGRPGVSFQVDDALSLASVADASIDMVVALDLLVQVEDWHAALATFRRVLRPDGRLLVSVPDRARDASGKDPRPGHLHVFDWTGLAAGLGEHFIVEARFVQAAPGGFKGPASRRVLAKMDLRSEVEAEWLVAVASANPLDRGQALAAGFTHPAFAAALAASGAPVVDFAASYENPFLVRPLVQMGERLDNADRLAALAELVLTTATPGSADQGAALCVLGYRVLGDRATAIAGELVALIEAYLVQSAAHVERPHVVRWRLSLAFLAGRLCQLAGDIDGALAWFHQTATGSWEGFSPLIATKAVAAAMQEAGLHLARGEHTRAVACFRLGLERALEAIRGDLGQILGDPAQPIPFGLTELAELTDMGAQCANALHWVPVLERDPGLFWRQVDMKRFGLATWAADMQRANDQLTRELLARRGASQNPSS